jgi:phosphoenolpyruvate synthase/pyruvate phosphate dikinase
MPQAERIVKFDVKGYDPEVADVGGKGASLIKLYRAGIPVPNGFVVTTRAYNEFREQGLPDNFQSMLLESFDSLGAQRVAVRSSAVSEDSDTASWAGQFESFMNVTRGTLVESIKKCWASVEDALTYAETQNTSGDGISIAIVVQKMVDSDVAGVAFSVNPISHDSNQIMIEATYGLGELLVQGMVNPDNYVVSKSDGGILSKHLSTKAVMLAYKDGATQQVPVVNELQDTSCLSDNQLSEIGQMVSRIEQYYGKPQDIEFAYSNNVLSIVQSRPITTV